VRLVVLEIGLLLGLEQVAQVSLLGLVVVVVAIFLLVRTLQPSTVVMVVTVGVEVVQE
jgi:hypothetical protein